MDKKGEGFTTKARRHEEGKLKALVEQRAMERYAARGYTLSV
jgi:hypothetical protein